MEQSSKKGSFAYYKSPEVEHKGHKDDTKSTKFIGSELNAESVIKLILKEAFYVHSAIGPGMLESVYQSCLSHRLRANGLYVETEKPVPVIFEGIKLDCGYRADIVVERKVVIDTKNIDAIADIHVAQLLTYLRFLDIRHGIILNFKTVLLKKGIRRVLNGYGNTGSK